MPNILDFANSQNNPISRATAIGPKLIKSLTSPSPISALSAASVNNISRIRSFPIAKATSSSKSATKLSCRVNFGAGTIEGKSQTRVTGFVNTIPVAVPKGKLLIAVTDPLLNPGFANPALHSYRMARLDSLPIFAIVEGQRLEDLSGLLQVKGRDLVTQALYNFQCSMVFAAPTSEIQTVQRRSGRIQIEPNQTESFPLDKEVLCQYKFTLTDGNGRTYTIEVGSFTIYPALI